MTPYELSLPPKPGEMLLFVELSLVENLSIAQCLSLLERMGYAPQLRYRQWRDPSGICGAARSGIQQIGLFALLKHEQHPPETFVESDVMLEEWAALAQVIQPSTAVYCPRGLPKRPIAA